MNSSIGNYVRVAIQQLDARALYFKNWHPANKRSRKYKTRFVKATARERKAFSRLTEQDKDTIIAAARQHIGKKV